MEVAMGNTAIDYVEYISSSSSSFYSHLFNYSTTTIRVKKK